MSDFELLLMEETQSEKNESVREWINDELKKNEEKSLGEDIEKMNVERIKKNEPTIADEPKIERKIDKNGKKLIEDTLNKTKAHIKFVVEMSAAEIYGTITDNDYLELKRMESILEGLVEKAIDNPIVDFSIKSDYMFSEKGKVLFDYLFNCGIIKSMLNGVRNKTNDVIIEKELENMIIENAKNLEIDDNMNLNIKPPNMGTFKILEQENNMTAQKLPEAMSPIKNIYDNREDIFSKRVDKALLDMYGIGETKIREPEMVSEEKIHESEAHIEPPKRKLEIDLRGKICGLEFEISGTIKYSA